MDEKEIFKRVAHLEIELRKHHWYISKFFMYLCSGLGLLSAIIPTAFLRYPFDYLCALVGVVYFLLLFEWVQKHR